MVLEFPEKLGYSLTIFMNLKREFVIWCSTINKKYEGFAISRLEKQNICFLKQEVNAHKINLFFGKKECLDAVKFMLNRPLNLLTPEEDFILGAMLGYDICRQCERYCSRKSGQ